MVLFIHNVKKIKGATQQKLMTLTVCVNEPLELNLTSVERNYAFSYVDSCSFKILSFNCTGFVSIRYAGNGTIFIQNACDVLDDFWDTKDVLAMSTVVNIQIYFVSTKQKSKPDSVCCWCLALN